MATRSEHLAQSASNEDLATALANGGHFDWAVTLLFYAALHLVQAYLVDSNLAVRGHVQREVRLRQIAQTQPIIDSYKLLREHSENARYECHSFSSDEFKAILEGHYGLVRQVIYPLLGK